jgi:phosphoserine phosphatase
MQAHSATCILVSGGFTFFTGAIAKELGFDHNFGNTLDIADGILTGKVGEPIQDKHSKLECFNRFVTELGILPQDVITIGDGANDLPMLKAAGLGIGYYAKQTVKDEMCNLIQYGDLTAVLYAQGYTAQQIGNV